MSHRCGHKSVETMSARATGRPCAWWTYSTGTADAWFKSSYSGGNGACIEAADLGNVVGVRDSKVPTGPAFTVSPAAFAAFTAYARTVSL